VGKENIGLSVRELGRFPKLWGKLFIKNMENVIDVVEAYDSNLKSKEHIDELTLQWGKETDDSLKDKDVHNMLQPSPNLKKLSIDLYGGTSFPSWAAAFSQGPKYKMYVNIGDNWPRVLWKGRRRFQPFHSTIFIP
ncbi:CC-NBS-LRR resistance protein, partial [Trifolium medium]|nr:CC-NBS-LRR resistance protein [Trifolium medium]